MTMAPRWNCVEPLDRTRAPGVYTDPVPTTPRAVSSWTLPYSEGPMLVGLSDPCQARGVLPTVLVDKATSMDRFCECKPP